MAAYWCQPRPYYLTRKKYDLKKVGGAFSHPNYGTLTLIGGPQLVMKPVCLEYGHQSFPQFSEESTLTNKLSQDNTNSIIVVMYEYSMDIGTE